MFGEVGNVEVICINEFFFEIKGENFCKKLVNKVKIINNILIFFYGFLLYVKGFYNNKRLEDVKDVIFNWREKY